MKKITIDDDVDYTETEEFADAFIDMVCDGGGGDVADEISVYGGVVLSKPKKQKKPKKKTMVNFFQPRLPMMEG